MASALFVASLSVALSVCTWFLLRKASPRAGSYPPGPSGIPFFGVLFQLESRLWLVFTRWYKQYGPIVYLNIAGQPIVLLNTHKVAADLLDRRASIYSDRPRNIVASELLTGGLLVVFTRYGHTWRKLRKAAHEGLNRVVSQNFHQTEVTEAVLLTNALLDNPISWEKHIRRAAASFIISLVYDIPYISDEKDPRIKHINDFVGRLVASASPGAHFVEFFPWMLYLPNWLAPWKRRALQHHQHDSVIFQGLFEDVRKRKKQGDQRPSFTGTLLENQEKSELSDKEASWLAATLYAAGSETSSAVLTWFFLAMVLYPEVQKKAQAELDSVVGRSRMPTFADLEHLPYMQAVVKEALRWNPVDPMGLPHMSIEDDIYEGQFIPKGTLCIANVWAMNRDPDVYGADADEFNPSRYLDEKGQIANIVADTKEEGHVTFGFGRRICVGRHVANDFLFINIASILWAFTIRPVEGPAPSPEDSINNGLVVKPAEFECKITPRFPEAESLVRNAKELCGL